MCQGFYQRPVWVTADYDQAGRFPFGRKQQLLCSRAFNDKFPMSYALGGQFFAEAKDCLNFITVAIFKIPGNIILVSAFRPRVTTAPY